MSAQLYARLLGLWGQTNTASLSIGMDTMVEALNKARQHPVNPDVTNRLASNRKQRDRLDAEFREALEEIR